MQTSSTARPSRSDRYAARVALTNFFAAHKDLAAVASPAPRVWWHSPLPLNDVKRILWSALRETLAVLGQEARPLPQYAEVAEWLADNQGRGLLLCGTCGQGKTILGRYVLPRLLLEMHSKIVHPVDAQAMNSQLSEMLNFHIISIDDIGTEPQSQFRNCAFADLVDRAEKKGGLMIITTNLNGEQLRERYGDRVLDRLRGLTRQVYFTGQSFRE
ncbi:MAG: ATP-binding protein [Bacteroidales bacterium]|nr:ATP-binding protein [Bacteroidales bacterium]